MNNLKYKNLIDESIDQINQFEIGIKRIRKSKLGEHEEEANNLFDSISSFILELLQESKLVNDDEHKSSLLKILAIKAVCLIDWNLNELEKEIPFVELNDMMEYLVFLTNLQQDNQKTKNHKLKKLTSIDLIKLNREQIFVLQFYLRWSLRLKLSSKNHYFGKNKSKKINLTNTKETIDHLELFLKYLNSNDLFKPISSCFLIRNDKSKKDIYSFDLNWNNMAKFDKDEIRNIINYDLGMYFFQQEEYEEAFYYFQSVKDYKIKIQKEENKLNELNSYANELESYLIACKSMLNIDIEEESCTTTIISSKAHSIHLNEDDINTKQVITKMVLIENCIKNNLKIPEESFLVLIQNMYHKNIDEDLKKKFQEFMELIMEAKGKDFEIEEEDEDDEDHQFDDDDEEYDDNEDDDDDEDEENYDDEDDDDDEYYAGNDEDYHHESCCPNHANKLRKEENKRLDFSQPILIEQTYKTSSQRKKEKRKLRKKLKKLQKEENTTISTTSSNTTTTTTSTINVNEIINEKNKDLKLIRKKLNKEARERAEKELEKELQKIINSSKQQKTSNHPQPQQQKNQTKSNNKKKAKSKNKPKINQPVQQNKTIVTNTEEKENIQTVIELEKEQELEVEHVFKPKTFGDLDDFSELDLPKKLNDLDDFECIVETKPSKLNSLDDFNIKSNKIEKLNDLDDFYDEPQKYNHTQKLVITEDKFSRVIGPQSSNLNLIEKVTNAKLKIENRTVLINGDSLEIVEFALELIHTLLNDPQADLLHLLPVEQFKPTDIKPVEKAKPKSVQRISKPVQTAQPTPAPITKSKATQVIQAKPRNFAEAVAKKPIHIVPVKTSVPQMINNTTQTISQPILASIITNRPISVVPPLKNEIIEEKLEDLKIEINHIHNAGASSSDTLITSQSLGSLSSSTSSSSSSEQKQESVFDAFSQLWSLNDNDLLDRLSPFLSMSSTNIDKINTTANTTINIATSKPIGYERNGKLQQANTSSEKQFTLINPIVNQQNVAKKNTEPIQRPSINNFSSSVPSNQWVNYNSFHQQQHDPFMNQNYMYQNYGFNPFTINTNANNGFTNVQLAPQIQPNVILQPAVGSIFPQQQYRY